MPGYAVLSFALAFLGVALAGAVMVLTAYRKMLRQRTLTVASQAKEVQSLHVKVACMQKKLDSLSSQVNNIIKQQKQGETRE